MTPDEYKLAADKIKFLKNRRTGLEDLAKFLEMESEISRFQVESGMKFTLDSVTKKGTWLTANDFEGGVGVPPAYLGDSYRIVGGRFVPCYYFMPGASMNSDPAKIDSVLVVGIIPNNELEELGKAADRDSRYFYALPNKIDVKSVMDRIRKSTSTGNQPKS